jgi:glycosyltransferase involved in cell wall biosynthesis
MFSIVMPLFNKEREVARALRSVMAQKFDDYELIVVNDGSTDNGPTVVKSFSDPRIRLINQENAGVSSARNRGIAEARSEFIAFLDADDEWLPNFLVTINKLRRGYPHCSVFATNFLYRNVDGCLMPTILRGLPKATWEGVLEDYFKVASQSDPPISSSAVSVRKEALASIGGFPAGVTAGEDLLTWAKLASKHSIAYSNQPAAIFCLRESLWGHPTRVPDSVDIVGQELEGMLANNGNKTTKGLKEYVAHWHQMRASIFLRLGKHKEAIYEVKEISKYSKQNVKLYLFFALALMPRSMCNLAFATTNLLKSNRRRIIIPKNAIEILI